MENPNNKIIIIGAFLAIIAISGVWLYSQQSGGPTVAKSPVLAHVGSGAITEKDVEYKFRVEKAYGNKTINGEDALQLLVNEAVEQEVAKVLKVHPMSIDLISTKEHVDRTSKAPEILKAVKDVFGADVASYDRIYILPKIVNPALHAFFSKNAEINKEASNKIEKALSEAIAGGNFADIAKNNGLMYATSTQSSVAPPVPPAMQKYVSNKDIPKSPMVTLLESMKPGEVSKTPIEDNYSYSIVRLVSSEKSVYKTENIVSVKPDYDTWYREEAKKIPVEILK